MEDIETQRKNSRLMAERISRILAGNISGVDANIRYTYQEQSFRLWWGERGDPDYHGPHYLRANRHAE